MVSLICWLIGNAESISGLNAAIDLANLGQPLVNHPQNCGNVLRIFQVVFVQIDLHLRTGIVFLIPVLIGAPHFVVVVLKLRVVVDLLIVAAPFFDSVENGLKRSF